MNRKIAILLLVTVIISCGGCTNMRYLTDQTSIERQHDMRAHRVGKNIGEGSLNVASFIISGVLNSDFVAIQSERAFRKISIINQSTDSLFVNMVTDIAWKEDGYCDIMGIVLPPGAKQKLLVPYPAAYNVYFKTPYSDEEKIEIRTDGRHGIIKLKEGMTKVPDEQESNQ